MFDWSYSVWSFRPQASATLDWAGFEIRVILLVDLREDKQIKSDKSGSSFFGGFLALRGPRRAPEAAGMGPVRKVLQVAQISPGDQI